jgi:hypothetical protein
MTRKNNVALASTDFCNVHLAFRGCQALSASQARRAPRVELSRAATFIQALGTAQPTASMPLFRSSKKSGAHAQLISLLATKQGFGR